MDVCATSEEESGTGGQTKQVTIDKKISTYYIWISSVITL